MILLRDIKEKLNKLRCVWEIYDFWVDEFRLGRIEIKNFIVLSIVCSFL